MWHPLQYFPATLKLSTVCTKTDFLNTLLKEPDSKILEIKTDQKLSIHQHIKRISKEAGQKLSALLTICPYLKEKKGKSFVIQWSNPNLITVH